MQPLKKKRYTLCEQLHEQQAAAFPQIYAGQAKPAPQVGLMLLHTYVLERCANLGRNRFCIQP